MPQTNPLQQSFEVINQASGGVAQQVVSSAKDAASETIQQIANTPLDILRSLIGVSSDSQSESSTSGSNPMSNQDPSSPNADTVSPDFTQKVEADRQKREALLRQHRMVLQQYEEQFKKTQQQKQQEEQIVEQQEEQEKQNKKIEEKRKKEPMWRQIMKGQSGAHESQKIGS